MAQMHKNISRCTLKNRFVWWVSFILSWQRCKVIGGKENICSNKTKSASNLLAKLWNSRFEHFHLEAKVMLAGAKCFASWKCHFQLKSIWYNFNWLASEFINRDGKRVLFWLFNQINIEFDRSSNNLIGQTKRWIEYIKRKRSVSFVDDVLLSSTSPTANDFFFIVAVSFVSFIVFNYTMANT